MTRLFSKPKLKPWILLLLLAQASVLQAGCGYVAAGVVVGHEIEEEDDD